MIPTQLAISVDAASGGARPMQTTPDGPIASKPTNVILDGVPVVLEVPHITSSPLLRRTVTKLTLVDRLIAAGLVDNALAALASDPIAKLRFDAAVEIAPDDPQVCAFLAAIGGDPDALLGPS